MANMANMATNLANIRQSLNKNLNDMAKRPYESGNFNENVDFGEKSTYKSNKEEKGPVWK